VPSYDDLYNDASSFEELYEAIVADLVSLALAAEPDEVIYAVPGSPNVAERTVELLLERDDVHTVLEPAVSVIDLACAAVQRDPLAVGLHVVDALGTTNEFRGPGPLLILQTYSPEVLASVADRLPPSLDVTVLYHLGLADELITTLRSEDLASFHHADHLTSLWVEEFRDAGVAMADLVDLVKRLRAECPWDQEQTHASLTRHLLEEAYETLDALEAFVAAQALGGADNAVIDHLQEELGDLLFQVLFHAELGDEEGNFSLSSIADSLRDKLIGRHPHVFSDATVSGVDEVASRWEDIKRNEKGRDSVIDGVPWQLPALALYTKLLQKATLVALEEPSSEASRDRAIEALRALPVNETSTNDDVERLWGDAIRAFVSAASAEGVDLEGALRERARELRDEIVRAEAHP
jgi:tetrapyrrole methylase family protein/MazG family protein